MAEWQAVNLEYKSLYNKKCNRRYWIECVRRQIKIWYMVCRQTPSWHHRCWRTAPPYTVACNALPRGRENHIVCVEEIGIDLCNTLNFCTLLWTIACTVAAVGFRFCYWHSCCLLDTENNNCRTCFATKDHIFWVRTHGTCLGKGKNERELKKVVWPAYIALQNFPLNELNAEKICKQTPEDLF